MKKRAFTLIELLIVLVIIGILAALALPQYQKFAIKAQAAEAKYVLRALADDLWEYHIETGAWPDIPGIIGSTENFSLFAVKPPVSNYFKYRYHDLIFSGAVGVSAESKEQVEESAPRMWYCIIFVKDVADHYGGKGHQVDEHWYAYYWYIENPGGRMYDWDGTFIRYM